VFGLSGAIPAFLSGHVGSTIKTLYYYSYVHIFNHIKYSGYFKDDELRVACTFAGTQRVS
jgi:hypothetical protein